MLTASSITLLPIVVMFYPKQLSMLTTELVVYSTFFVLICSVFIYFLCFEILKRIEAGHLLMSALVIIPSAILLNTIIMNEILAYRELTGLLIISAWLLIIDGRFF